MRERPNSLAMSFVSVRITPACAGKTFTRRRFEEHLRDHPRMCGKDPDLGTISKVSLGSPPHVRERLFFLCYGVQYSRITPACAGKTAMTGPRSLNTGDHPRMCGKDAVTHGNGLLSIRITPACAGKTTSRHHPQKKYKDHPRMCGKDHIMVRMWQ